MANEAIGYGTQLQLWDETTMAFATVARVTEIGEFGLGEADDIDITAHDTTTKYREFIAGLVDAGEVEITGIWTADDTQTDLASLVGSTEEWQIVLPGSLGTFGGSGTNSGFMGYIKSGPTWNPQLEDRIEFSFTIKISGKPTFTVTP